MRGAREPRATVRGVGAGSRPGGRPVVSQKALAERMAVGPSRKSGCMKGTQAGKGTEDPRWPGRGTRVSLVSVAGQRSTRRCLCVDIGSERKQKKTKNLAKAKRGLLHHIQAGRVARTSHNPTLFASVTELSRTETCLPSHLLPGVLLETAYNISPSISLL